MNIVVGAASGMGAAVARAIEHRGDLLLADKNGEAVAALAEKMGQHVYSIAGDLTVERDVAALAALVDRVDALVVTAGLSPSMGTAREIFDVNVVGVASLLHALDFAIGQGSVAVCFASIAGHGHDYPPEIVALLDDPLAPDFFCRLASADADARDPGRAYSLSKHAVIRLVQRLAPVWGRRGARIVSLSPGIVNTPMGRFELDRMAVMREMIANSALARTGDPDEVAAVAAFLCSSAASFVTGCDVLVDGGCRAGMSRE